MHLILIALLSVSASMDQPAPQRKQTVVGTTFLVDPRFEKVISEQIVRARRDIKAARERGKFIAYLSLPISGRGGGYEPTNLAIARHTRKRLEERHGGRLWVLDPTEYQLLQVDGREPQGGDYLWMWTEILAGPDGNASDFDLVYYLGPSDMEHFFRPYPGATHLERVQAQLEGLLKIAEGQELQAELKAKPERRREYVAFYGLRASAAWSKGAHDEWNLFVRINKKRGVGQQLPCWFDGRALSPAELEQEIAPGYEIR
jgi:hypothetical protein